MKDEIDPVVDITFKICTPGDPELYMEVNTQPNTVTAVTAPRLRDMEEMAPPAPKES